MSSFPSLLNNFNIYGKDKYLGVSSETTLPNFEAMTETIDGAGIGGEIEEAVVGEFSSMESEMTFQNISTHYFLAIAREDIITCRGSMQYTNTANLKCGFKPIVVVIGGKVKSYDLGTLKKGAKGEPKIIREVSYCKITIDGKEVLELDKYNLIYKINGTDKMEKIRSQI